MKPTIKKIGPHSKENQEDLDFWQKKSFEYKLQVSEAIRRSGEKLKSQKPDQQTNADQQRLRRVIRVVKQK